MTRVWRDRCIGQPHTITLFKSTNGAISGGYLHIPWNKEGGFHADYLAFIFSLDHELKLVPQNPHKAVWCKANFGPRFGGGSLSVGKNERMNAFLNCECKTNASPQDSYNVPTDEEGNSILSKTGKGRDDSAKLFTLDALETWQVLY